MVELEGAGRCCGDGFVLGVGGKTGRRTVCRWVNVVVLGEVVDAVEMLDEEVESSNARGQSVLVLLWGL